MRAEAERVEAVVEAEMGRLVADGVRQAEAERVVREARVAGRQAAAGTIQRFVRGVGVRRTAREAEIAEAARVEAVVEAEAERVEAVVRAEMGRLRLGWRGRGAGRGRGSGGGG